jgi:hypothetical protein
LKDKIGENIMMNPAKLLKMKSVLDKFSKSHPKFVQFLDVAQKNAIEEGTVIDINVTSASGKTLSSNLKLTQSDVEMFRELSGMFGNK